MQFMQKITQKHKKLSGRQIESENKWKISIFKNFVILDSSFYFLMPKMDEGLRHSSIF